MSARMNVPSELQQLAKPICHVPQLKRRTKGSELNFEPPFLQAGPTKEEIDTNMTLPEPQSYKQTHACMSCVHGAD